MFEKSLELGNLTVRTVRLFVREYTSHPAGSGRNKARATFYYTLLEFVGKTEVWKEEMISLAHGPKRPRYSPEVRNALTISALTKLPLN